MHCVDGCSLEQVQRDPRSIGVVEDSELIARAGFAPNHYDKKGQPKIALVSKGQMLAGQISVWRAKEVTPKGCHTILSKLKPPHENQVKELFFVAAREVRLTVPQGGLGRFCVLDECEIDDDGSFDPLHAHVSACKGQPDQQFDELKLEASRIALLNLFKNGRRWLNPMFSGI